MRYLAIFVAVATAQALASETDPPDTHVISLSGFGTLGAVSSSQRQADYVTSSAQPAGAGYSHGVDLGPDSRLGVQLDGKLSDKFTGVVQVVSQYQYDNSYTPAIEWASLQYRVTPDWNVRAGRVALPIGMVSDYRLVGYANPWVRPPIETYGIIPITSIDGVDTTLRSHVGPATNSLQVLFGSHHGRFPEHGRLDARDVVALSESLEYRSFNVRASYASTRVFWRAPATDALFGGLDQLGGALSGIPALSSYGAKALDLEKRYDVDGQRVHSVALGASWDDGQWLVMAEWLHLTGAGWLADNTGGYVTAGYRIRQFTPYVTLARTHSAVPSEPGIPLAGLSAPFDSSAATLDAGLTRLLWGSNVSQTTLSAGVRWDVHKGIDLKLQYDHIRMAEGSGGAFVNPQPGFKSGDSAHVFSLAVDFVF